MSLQLKIQSCKGLEKGSYEFNSYVRFKWAGKKYKTFVKTNSENPCWAAEFNLPHDGSVENLRLELWRVICSEAKTMVGSVKLKLTGLTPDKTACAWYDLKGCAGQMKCSLKYQATVVRSRGVAREEEAADCLTMMSDDEEEPPAEVDASVAILKKQFPSKSTEQIQECLDSSNGDLVAAGAKLLTQALAAKASSFFAPKKTDDVAFELAKDESDDEGVDLCYASDDEAEEELDTKKTASLDLIKTLLPYLNKERIVQALKENGWSKTKAMDTLFDDQIATLAITSQAQTQAASATASVAATSSSEDEGDFGVMTEDRAAQIPHEALGFQAAGHVGTLNDYIPPSGRKKALLIGVNYFGTANELRGCISDVQRIRKLITSVYHFPDHPNCLTQLCDDNPDKRFHPTRRNIILAIDWLVKGARKGDVLFFHFSGHGSQQRDTAGDEESGYDETILPVDYKTAGQIIDDELNAHLVMPLPEGVKLTCVLDCCHSGTGLDLPYLLDRTSGKWRQETNPKFAQCGVQMFSGCKDDETSADVMVPSFGAGGAMSLALLSSLTQNPFNFTYRDLMNHIHSLMKSRGFTQQPQLSSTQAFDMEHKFSLVDYIIPNLNTKIGRDVPKQKPKKKSRRKPRRKESSGSE